jgi:HlyD family secretion protein
VLEVENPDLLLRPGMTATAQIVTTSIPDALLIPNAALRFTPEGEDFTGASAGRQASALSALMPQMRRRGRPEPQQSGKMGRLGRAFVLENGSPALVLFRPGATDGRTTQVLPLGGAAPDPDRLARANPEAAERIERALTRPLEAGTRVVVDLETAPDP